VSAKEQSNSNDRAASKQPARQGAKTSSALAQQSNAAALDQRAMLNSRLLRLHKVLQLQETIGNQAAQRSLYANVDRYRHATSGLMHQPVSGRVQRDPVDLDPVVISDDPATQQRLQQQSDQMMARFPEVWRGFCRDWYDAAINALSSVPDPPNPYEARNFCIALGGNLAWAMTSISVAGSVGGLGAVAVIGTSAIGAGAGTGVFARPGPPSGRGTVASVLAAQRGMIEQQANRRIFSDVAASCIVNPQAASNSELQDRMLWQRFAPGIDFDNRASVMLENAQQRLSSWLGQFQQQYMAWKARPDVIAKAREYELGDAVLAPYGDPFDILGDLIGIGTPADPFFEAAQQDIPFVPVFVN
jgi:hypothetical protein